MVIASARTSDRSIGAYRSRAGDHLAIDDQ
jgi:hypothetical protein